MPEKESQRERFSECKTSVFGTYIDNECCGMCLPRTPLICTPDDVSWKNIRLNSSSVIWLPLFILTALGGMCLFAERTRRRGGNVWKRSCSSVGGATQYNNLPLTKSLRTYLAERALSGWPFCVMKPLLSAIQIRKKTFIYDTKRYRIYVYGNNSEYTSTMCVRFV